MPQKCATQSFAIVKTKKGRADKHTHAHLCQAGHWNQVSEGIITKSVVY